MTGLFETDHSDPYQPYAEYAQAKSNIIEGYTIVEQEIIDQLCTD